MSMPNPQLQPNYPGPINCVSHPPPPSNMPMPNFNSPLPTKYSGPLSLGSKIIRITLPHLPRHFTVHEDLICKSSAVLHTRLQANRKPLLPTDECPVCIALLDPIQADVAFCKECGQNVHEACIATWKAEKQGTADATPCPMCRAPWKFNAPLKYISITGPATSFALTAYLAWLYAGNPFLPATPTPTPLALAQMWQVAETLDDSSFRRAVALRFLDHDMHHTTPDLGLGIEAAEWVWTQRQGSQDLRDFLVVRFLCVVPRGWFSMREEAWPQAFVNEFADTFLAGAHVGGSWDGMRERFLCGGVANGCAECQRAGVKGNEARKREHGVAVPGAAPVPRPRPAPAVNGAADGAGDGSVGGRRVRARVS